MSKCSSTRGTQLKHWNWFVSKYFMFTYFLAVALLFFTGCKSENSDIDLQNEITPTTKPKFHKLLKGSGVKGPLVNARVEVFAFDSKSIDLRSDKALATTTTNENANFSKLGIGTDEDPLNPPYFLVITSTDQTVDITTGKTPVISTLQTVITQAMLDSNAAIYATPLSTITTKLAVEYALSNSSFMLDNSLSIRDNF